jgi:hypothetical protein
VLEYPWTPHPKTYECYLDLHPFGSVVTRQKFQYSDQQNSMQVALVTTGF